MSNLQKEFFKQKTDELNPTAPFLDLREVKLTLCLIYQQKDLKDGGHEIKWKI